MYVTISFVCTNTGSFGWVYVAVVPVSLINVVASTCGILLVTSSLFTPVINLRNAKSMYVTLMYSTSSSSSPFHSFGVESLSVTGLPLSSVSSAIWAWFSIIFG